MLASNMTAFHALLTVLIVFGIGDGALYKADVGRHPERGPEVGGIPLRFVPLILVSYAAVFFLVVAFAAPATIGASSATTAKTVGVGAIFSVIGAATADSLF